MNFYKHHIGDYAQATAHLSFAEDAAYSRLLRKYYAEEKPIPADLKAAQRLVGARTREERDAVSTVLAEFFDLQADGWHNKRADEEIAEARALEEDRDARRANEAERQRRHRERRRELFEILREHGQVPKFDTKTEALEAMVSRVTGDDRTRDTDVTDPAPSRVTEGVGHAVATANQTPDARHQTRSRADTGERTDLPAAPGAAGAICAAMRTAGLTRSNPGDPRLLAAIAAGCTTTEFVGITREALSHDPPKGFAWIVATTHGRRRDAANGATRHEPRNRTSLADQVRDPSDTRDDGNVLEGTATRVARR